MSTISRRDLLKYGLYSGLIAASNGGFWIGGCTKGRSKRPNIVLITLDTTRADRLGCYGYHQNTSPNLDQLAGESTIYTSAIAPSSWTLPSHASLFTGKFPSSHGSQYDPKGPLKLTDAIVGDPSWRQYRVQGLAKQEVTMADILKRTGYKTGAVVAGPWMKKVFGLHKGFSYYDDDQIGTTNGRLAEQVTASAIKWIEKSKREEFFLFLNYFDPHWPYLPPEDLAMEFLPANIKMPTKEKVLRKKLSLEEADALYAGEILYMDQHIGRLLKKLKDSGLYDKTWIIVTADHGQLHGEHGKFGHGKYLYQEELHVPLFMKFPLGEETRMKKNIKVQLIDILPTICKRLRLAIPEGIQGTALPKIEHPIIAETYPPAIHSKDGSWRAIFDGDYKFLWNSKGRHLLFNLRDDPAELINIAGHDQLRVKKMINDLDQYLVGLPQPVHVTNGPDKEIDKATKDALKSLGYVQ